MRSRIGTWKCLGAAALSVAVVDAAAFGQLTVRASLDSSGNEGNGESREPSMAAGARYVAFTSEADNLVPGDGNGVADVFVRDLVTGTTEMVSVSNLGTPGNGASGWPSISRDGRYVAFQSDATNFTPNDFNGARDIFVHDRTLGLTWRVSDNSSGNQGNGDSEHPAVSADGRFVAFESDADNLVLGDGNAVRDVFACSLGGGGMERLSVDTASVEGNGLSISAGLSSDGAVAVFESAATNLDAGDTNAVADIFVRDRVAGTTTRVNLNAGGNQCNAPSVDPVISADASTVAFETASSNLVSGDTNGTTDVFVVDLASGVVERVSVRSNGNESADQSRWPALSRDGTLVSFTGFADDLTKGDGNGVPDVFVHDRASGVTWRASLASDSTEGDLASLRSSLTDDGTTIAFGSDATTLVPADRNGERDVFARREPVATWENYGAGFPGTLGVPAFVATTSPQLGTTFRVHADDSLGAPTAGLVFLGFDSANLPTTAGGTLLVDMLLALPVSLPAAGLDLAGAVPDDETLGGIAFYMQVLEGDAGAAKGISFSRGLKIVLGR